MKKLLVWSSIFPLVYCVFLTVILLQRDENLRQFAGYVSIIITAPTSLLFYFLFDILKIYEPYGYVASLLGGSTQYFLVALFFYRRKKKTERTQSEFDDLLNALKKKSEN